MDLTNNTQLVLLIVVALIVVGFLAMAVGRAQRTRRLKERFGPEYERAVEEIGDKRKAERELAERVAHVQILNIRPLSAEQVNQYSLRWQETQREFVDEPLAALQKADRLIQEVMKVKGYPVNDFEQRVADISVDYPELVTDYRGMHRIASREATENVTTEEIRQAMIHGRALFENLITQKPNEQEFNRKEKI
jgi:hypothetical protein